MKNRMRCINCGQTHSFKYCPFCGEKAETKKLSLENVVGDAISSISNMDKGFLYNVKALTLYPKEIIFSYIKGKRSGILNPITFLVITISLYLIVETIFKYPVDSNQNSDNTIVFKTAYNIGYAFGKVFIEYFKFFWIFTVLLYSNVTKLLFGKYNYVEHITINSFILGYATFLTAIGYILLKVPIVFNPILYVAMSILTYHVYNDKKDKLNQIVLSGISIILFIMQIFFVGIAMGIVILYFLK